MRDRIKNEYFEWLYDWVWGIRGNECITFRKLLIRLHQIEFRYLIHMDRNRASDGIDLRYRFALTTGYEDSPEVVMNALDGPCSVLEMILALAIRCEEDYMDDPSIGSRVPQWFWGMIRNLGLISMSDAMFDKDTVDAAVERLLNREYEPNGEGGLFTVKNRACDLRNVEIWDQLCWYLDDIV